MERTYRFIYTPYVEYRGFIKWICIFNSKYNDVPREKLLIRTHCDSIAPVKVKLVRWMCESWGSIIQSLRRYRYEYHSNKKQ